MTKWFRLLACLILCSCCVSASYAAESPYGYGGFIQVGEILPNDLSELVDIDKLKASIPAAGPKITWVDGLPQVTDEGFSGVCFFCNCANCASDDRHDLSKVGGIWRIVEGENCSCTLLEDAEWTLAFSTGSYQRCRDISYGYRGMNVIHIQIVDSTPEWEYGWKDGLFMANWRDGHFHASLQAARTDRIILAEYNDLGEMKGYSVCGVRGSATMEAEYTPNDELDSFWYHDWSEGISANWYGSMHGGMMGWEGNPTEEMATWGAKEIMKLCPPQHVRQQPSIEKPGDADGNDGIDISDAIAILQYLNGTGSINTDNADVNGDGKVDVQDVLCILQHMAGWNVTLK